MQERRNSSASVIELHLSFTNQSTWWPLYYCLPFHNKHPSGGRIWGVYAELKSGLCSTLLVLWCQQVSVIFDYIITTTEWIMPYDPGTRVTVEWLLMPGNHIWYQDIFDHPKCCIVSSQSIAGVYKGHLTHCQKIALVIYIWCDMLMVSYICTGIKHYTWWHIFIHGWA